MPGPLLRDPPLFATQHQGIIVHFASRRARENATDEGRLLLLLPSSSVNAAAMFTLETFKLPRLDVPSALQSRFRRIVMAIETGVISTGASVTAHTCNVVAPTVQHYALWKTRKLAISLLVYNEKKNRLDAISTIRDTRLRVRHV